MTRGTQFIAVTAPFLALATVVLVLRLYTRFGILGNAGAEDVLVGFAWVGFVCDCLMDIADMVNRSSQLFCSRYLHPVHIPIYERISRQWKNANTKQ